MKAAPRRMVGMRAPTTSLRGETPFSKYWARMACPAGLGALAITVSPPPVTAPAAATATVPMLVAVALVVVVIH